MRVLLLNPPYIPHFMRNARWDAISISGSNWYPVWLGYCTGLLEKHGHECELLDAQNDNLTHEQTYKAAVNFGPDLTVLYFSTKSLDNDIMVGERIKKLTKSEIVLVGPWASMHPDKTLQKSDKIELLAEGEFDYTVLELANGTEKGKIKGLYWKDSSGELVKNEPRTPVPEEKLDEFPFVTDVYKRHLNIRNYYQSPHLHPFIDLFTGRGCSWGICTFCIWPNTINKGAPYRKRNMDGVIEELKFIKKELPFIKEIFIQDDTLPKDRAVELSNAILNNKLKITWSCYSRPDIDLETLKLMKESGCRTMHVGYESSNQQILKNIKKGITVKQMEQFTKNANKAGLCILADFIIGLPGETEDTIRATVKWAKRLKVHTYQFTVPKAYPTTPFYEWLKENKCLKDSKANYPGLSFEEICEWNKWALRQCYYYNPGYFFRMIARPRDWPRLVRSAKFLIPHLLGK